MSKKTINELKQELVIEEAKFDSLSESFEFVRVAYECARGQLESQMEIRNTAMAALLAAINEQQS